MSRLTTRSALDELFPFEATQFFRERFAHAFFAFQAKQLARGAIEVVDPALEIGDDDALVDRVEDCFQEAFFVCEAVQIILDLLGADASDPFDQFVEKTGVHYR